MVKAKDYFQSDLDTFINPDEFGVTHIINDVEMNIVIDTETLKERQTQKEIYEGDVLLHVKKIDYGETPAIGEIIELDNDIYRVSDFQDNAGLYTITLVANI